jgi:hypothetical protein
LPWSGAPCGLYSACQSRRPKAGKPWLRAAQLLSVKGKIFGTASAIYCIAPLNCAGQDCSPFFEDYFAFLLFFGTHFCIWLHFL